MTDVLEFIFRDFWTWLGALLLLFVASQWRPFHIHAGFKVNSPETDNSTNNRVEN